MGCETAPKGGPADRNAASYLGSCYRLNQSRKLITGQPRFSASARKLGSGSTAIGFVTCSSNAKSFIESL